jgi:hypothetical protein
MDKFIPDNFIPPKRIHLNGFILRTLSYKDAEIDYQSVMSSIDIIQKTRGGSWPTKDLTPEDNKIDLAWHQREFEYKNSFAYCVWDINEKEYLGCVYFYPLNKPWIKAPKGSDVVINMWVTQKSYDRGLYPKLFKTLKAWIKNDWPIIGDGSLLAWSLIKLN